MSYLKLLVIKDYKGFYWENKIHFAFPNQGESKIGLNVIVWPNNTGKTTILEALMLTDNSNNKRFNQEHRHSSANPELIFKNEEEQECKLTADWSFIKEESFRSPKFRLLSSSKHWNSDIFSDSEENNFIYSENRRSLRAEWTSSLSGFLSVIYKDSEKKEKFNQRMKKIFPNFSNWGIDTRNNKDYIYYQTGNWDRHSTDQLGKGLVSLFLICAHLTLEDDSILLIDEPEGSLHPQIQKNLWILISEAAKTRQIIICSHSPYFINWEDYLHWAKFIRLNKHADEKCTIHQLWDRKKYCIKGHLEDRHKPALLDTVAKEIFFWEKFLFVEGQEDVALIKKFLKDKNMCINYEFFWYGAWGYEKIESFLKLAKDLWIERAWILYDGDVPSDYYKERKKEFPKYKFRKLRTHDIRDKDPVYEKDWRIDKNAKNWLFDKKGRIKEKYERVIEEVLRIFSDYFK